MNTSTKFWRKPGEWLELLSTILPLAIVPLVRAGSDGQAEPSLGQGRFNSAAFSRDGKQVLTASGALAQIWEVETGKELRRFVGHTERVRVAVFGPDGKRVITGGGAEYDMGFVPKDLTARLWDEASGRELRRFAAGLVYAISPSPDGERILTVARSGASLWSAGTGELLYQFPVPTESRADGYLPFLSRASFGPDGRKILGLGFCRVTILEAATGKELRRLDGHAKQFRSAVFSPDGRLVLTASDDGTARTWDAETGGQLRILQGHQGPVQSAVYDAKGARIITASADGTVGLWDATTGEQIRRFTHPGSVNHAMISSDGQRIIASWETRDDDAENHASLWSVDDGRAIGQFRLGKYSVISIFSPDGKTILTSSHPNTLWDAKTGAIIRQYQ